MVLVGVRLQGKDVTWLGHVCWYSVAADSVTNESEGVSIVRLDDLTAWSQELNIELVSKPAPRTASAFRSASSQLSDRWQAGEGVMCELQVKHVRDTPDQVVRQIMLVTTDSRRQSVETIKAAEVKFHRPTRRKSGIKRGSEQVTHRLAPTLSDEVRDRCLVMMEKLKDAYSARQEYVMVQTLRKVVRDLLDARLEALQLRRSGVYFVSPERAELLADMKTLVSRFGEQACFEYMPLVDEPQQRRMVADALASECAEHLEAVQTLLTVEREFGPDKYRRNRLLIRHKWLTKRCDYYLDLLGSESTYTQVHLAEASRLLGVR